MNNQNNNVLNQTNMPNNVPPVQPNPVGVNPTPQVNPGLNNQVMPNNVPPVQPNPVGVNPAPQANPGLNNQVMPNNVPPVQPNPVGVNPAPQANPGLNNQVMPNNVPPVQPNLMGFNPAPQPAYNPNMNNNVPNKKSPLPIIIIAVVVIGAIVAGILLFTGKDKSGGSTINKSKYKKTLSCTFSSMGVTETYDYYFNDGAMTMSQTRKVAFSTYEFEGGTENEWVEQTISETKDACKSSGCTVKYNHKKGESFEITSNFSEDAVLAQLGDGIKDMAAEEMYNKLKTNMEAEGYTCK